MKFMPTCSRNSRRNYYIKKSITTSPAMHNITAYTARKWLVEVLFSPVLLTFLVKLQYYISLIRSRLEYCAAVWDPYLIKDINILEGIQRRAARFVMQDHSRFTSVSSLLKDLNWVPLKDRRRDIRLAMLFKIVRCNMPVQADAILLPADPRTIHHHSFKFTHILFSVTV